MAGNGPFQNAFQSLPVVARDPPPEGSMVAPLAFVLNSLDYAQNISFPLGAQTMTQVRTLIVDNAKNPSPVIVVHGVTLAQTTVPAAGGAIIPTTSNQGQFFVALSVDEAPLADVPVFVELYNYEIPPSLWGTQVIEMSSTVSTSALENPFHNAGANISQLYGAGAVAVAPGGPKITLDGWYVETLGAALNAQQQAGIGLSLNSLGLFGAGGNSGVNVTRRIEAHLSAPFYGQTVTLQFKVQNNSGAPVTPNIVLYHPLAPDVFSSLSAADFAAAAQACPSGATTVCALAFVMPTCSSGSQITIQLGPLVSGSLLISEIDLLVSQGVVAGLVSSPSPCRLRAPGIDMVFCQYYFRWLPVSIYTPGGAGATALQVPLSFPAMRATPAIGSLVVDPNTTQTTGNYGSQTFNNVTPYSALLVFQTGGTGAGYVTGYRATASAIL